MRRTTRVLLALVVAAVGWCLLELLGGGSTAGASEPNGPLEDVDLIAVVDEVEAGAVAPIAPVLREVLDGTPAEHSSPAPVADAAGPVIDATVEVATPVVAEAVAQIEPVVTPVLGELGPVAETVVVTAEPVVAPVLAPAQPTLYAAATVLDPVIEIVRPTVDALRPTLEPALDLAGPLVRPALGVVEPVLRSVAPSLARALNAEPGANADPTHGGTATAPVPASSPSALDASSPDRRATGPELAQVARSSIGRSAAPAPLPLPTPRAPLPSTAPGTLPGPSTPTSASSSAGGAPGAMVLAVLTVTVFAARSRWGWILVDEVAALRSRLERPLLSPG
jgi:hypothetical protein